MIPSPWVGVILVFATYRLVRLIGWDDFPLAAKIRGRVLGERWVLSGSVAERVAWADERIASAVRDAGFTIVPPNLDRSVLETIERERTEVNLPGKQPSSEAEDVRPAYDRPTLAHLIHCPFCLGFHISLGVYLFWVWQPHWTIVGLMPFALSGAVGLLAKNLDA